MPGLGIDAAEHVDDPFTTTLKRPRWCDQSWKRNALNRACAAGLTPSCAARFVLGLLLVQVVGSSAWESPMLS
jgi:hypothetical protein